MGALVLCSSSVSNTQNEWAPLKKPFISNAMHCLRKEFQSTAFKQSEQKLRCLRTAFTWYESRELPIGFRASLLIYRSRVLTNEQKTLLGGIVVWSSSCGTLKTWEIQTVLVCSNNLRSPQHKVCFKNEWMNDSFCILKSKKIPQIQYKRVCYWMYAFYSTTCDIVPNSKIWKHLENLSETKSLFQTEIYLTAL